jgi:ParB-like chromosome segregation protein Spo0J
MIVEISKIRNNTNNPRFIKDDKFRKLVKSIKEFPEMLELRPIVVDEDMIVLGGNMRLKACIEAGLKEVHIKIAENLTEEQKKEFIVKDNVGFGEWDWDLLANEWDTELLEEWGLDLKLTDDSEEEYTNDVKITLSLNNEYLEDFKNELDTLLSKHPNVLVKFKI